MTGSRHGGLTLLLPTATDPCSSMGGAHRSSVSLDVSTSIQCLVTVYTAAARSLAGVTLFPFAPCAFCSSAVWLALGFARPAKDRTFKMLFPQSARCRFFSSWTFSESAASGNQNSVTGLLFFQPFFLFSPLTLIHPNSAFGYYSANAGCLLSPSPLLF